MAKEKKYNDQACLILSTLGYSYDDIALIYSISTNTKSNKSSISKILSNYNVNKSNVRINPKKLNQKYIDFLQREGLFLPLLELYNKKYTKPVRDTKFKKQR